MTDFLVANSKGEYERCCICGHPESSHYSFLMNGEKTVCCSDCDPISNIDPMISNIELSGLSDLMHKAALHDFMSGPPRYELWDTSVGNIIGYFYLPEQVIHLLSHYEKDIPSDYSLSIDGEKGIDGFELYQWYNSFTQKARS